MIRRAVLAVLVLAAALPAARGGDSARGDGKGDALRRLEADPSVSASARLMRLLKGTKSPDQRFWLVRTLGTRLKERKDEAALEALLTAAKDPAPLVRGSALHSLSGFESLPREAVKGRWFERLESAAKGAEKDASPLVRDGGRELKRALDIFRDPAKREGPEPPSDAGAAPARSRLLRALSAAWLLVLPLSGGLWLLSGRPVFDAGSAEGRFAARAAAVLLARRGLLALCAVLWGALTFLLVGWGFEVVVWAFGRPSVEAGSWAAAYFAAWFCLSSPGAFVASGLARRPLGGSVGAALEATARVALLSSAAALLGPLGLLYRLLWRRAQGPTSPLAALLEEGALQAVARAAAGMSAERTGLIPALLERAGPAPRLGLPAYDPRFAFLCAAPLATILCALAAAAQSVDWTASRPSVLLGCTLWAWSVLAGLLTAGLGALQGVGAAARRRASHGLESPAELAALADTSPEAAP